MFCFQFDTNLAPIPRHTFSSTIDCKFTNGSFKVGKIFIREGCSERCTCLKRKNVGILSCEPLCTNKTPSICPPGQIIKVSRSQLNKKCFCIERRCVKRK